MQLGVLGVHEMHDVSICSVIIFPARSLMACVYFSQRDLGEGQKR